MRNLIRCSIGAVLFLTTMSANAQLAFNVSLNTSSLVGSPNGPFSLDFQLTDGSGSADSNNTVTLSNFQFGGGGAAGNPSLTGGGSGDIATTATLTDSDFFNEVLEGFTPGNTLSFDVNLAANVDAGGTPDELSFALLDSSGNIPTAGNGFLVIVDLDSANPNIQTFAADQPYSDIGTPSIRVLGGGKSVPEPGSMALLLGSAVPLGFLGFLRRRSSCSPLSY